MQTFDASLLTNLKIHENGTRVAASWKFQPPVRLLLGVVSIARVRKGAELNAECKS
jgi:hypothetical protein